MLNSAPLMSRDLVVSLDYGQFYLHCGETDPDLVIELIESALVDGVAQRDGLVVITSPHQNNFEMPLRVEVWPSAADDDLQLWEHAVQVHLEVTDEGLFYESPTLDEVDLDVQPGSYTALITGRGFVAEGWPGSTTPGDHWRIQLWPTVETAPPKLIKSFTMPEPAQLASLFTDSGVAAVHRIHRALDDRLPLGGERGTVRVSRRLPGTRRQLFSSFARPPWLLTSGGSDDDHGFIINGLYSPLDHYRDANLIAACDGEITGEVIEHDSPASVSFTWTWWVPDPTVANDGDSAEAPQRQRLIAPEPPMTLRFALTNAPPAEHWPTTTVEVTHDQVPTELIADLTDYWQWILEHADHEDDLSGARSKHARGR